MILKMYFGSNPRIKVMDFFLMNQDEKYTKMAISRATGVSRTTLQYVCYNLVSIHFLKQNGSKYRLNRLHKLVLLCKKFIGEMGK